MNNNDYDNNNNNDFAIRHRRRIQMIKRRKRIRRMLFLTVILAVTVLICMYKLPLFNVSQIKIEGNKKVTVEEIAGKTGINGGENLFRLNMKNISSGIRSIPYIESVSAKRSVFPEAAVVISVKECEMAACIKTAEGYAGIDKSAKVLEIMQEVPEGIVEFNGMKLTGCKTGEKIQTEDPDELKDMMTVIDAISNFAYKDKVGPISFEDTSNISFYFDNRLNVMCGSTIDFEEKMNRLEGTILSDYIKDNSRGTLDLRTSARVIYTP